MTTIGRPTKLTNEVQERICDVLRAGNYQDAACGYVGISENTYYQWLKKGETGQQPYADFREAVRRARAEAELRNVTLINRAAQSGQWQAAAWHLERSFPRKWGRMERLEMTGAEGGPIGVANPRDKLLNMLSDEESV